MNLFERRLKLTRADGLYRRQLPVREQLAVCICWLKFVCIAAGRLRRMAEEAVEFDAEVCVDVRENALIEEFRRHGATGFKIQALPIGDVSCTYRGGHGWLLERKTCEDFVASICDGRYVEQRTRFFSTHYRVLYVVEGDIRVSAARSGIGPCSQP